MIRYRKNFGITYGYTLLDRDVKFVFRAGSDKRLGGVFVWLVYGALHFKEGYSWNGPSGPIYPHRVWIIPSLVHDGLYQLMREGHLDRKLRLRVDWLFFTMGMRRAALLVTWYRPETWLWYVLILLNGVLGLLVIVLVGWKHTRPSEMEAA